MLQGQCYQVRGEVWSAGASTSLVVIKALEALFCSDPEVAEGEPFLKRSTQCEVGVSIFTTWRVGKSDELSKPTGKRVGVLQMRLTAAAPPKRREDAGASAVVSFCK